MFLMCIQFNNVICLCGRDLQLEMHELKWKAGTKSHSTYVILQIIHTHICYLKALIHYVRHYINSLHVSDSSFSSVYDLRVPS